MNKLTKAAIAGAVGIALLLGGAGSLAYWNDSATLSGAQIEAGTLSISASGEWSGEPALWVPGDEAVYSGTVTIDATGDNLKAELTLDESSLALTGDLAEALEIDFTADLSGLTTVTGADGVYTVTSSSTAIEIPVTVTVSFPFGDDVDNSTQEGTADLSGIDFLLTQIASS